jgi:hypothetical protein
VIYKENLPRTIGIGGNGGLMLCIWKFLWVTETIKLDVGNHLFR